MPPASYAGRGEPWKSDAGPAAAAVRRPPAGPLRYRTPWRVASAVAFFGLCAGLVWLVTWWAKPQPVRTIYLSAGYDTNLAVPHNSYGRRWTSDAANASAAASAELRREARWDAALRGVRSKTVVVVVSAHGGADDRGPYLLPTDAAPGPDVSSRLRVSAIVDRLAGLPAEKKVLVLDAGGMPPNPLFGPGDFAAALEGLGVEAVPNLSVLTACGPGERAWPAEVHRATAFGHFYRQGVAGAADANNDGRVTLLELFQYVKPRVQEWAERTRAAKQIPCLYPTGDEGERRAAAVVVAHLKNAPPPAADEPLPAFAPSPDVRAAWGRHAARAAQNPPPASYAPHLWRVYGATLIRAEELALAHDEAAAAAVLAEATKLEKQLDDARRTDVSDPRLAAAVFGAGPPDPDAKAVVDKLWGAAPDEVAKVTPTPAVYGLLLDRVSEGPARTAEIVRLLDRPGRPRPPAAHLLVTLAKNLSKEEFAARAGLIRTALTVHRTGELAAAGGGVGYGDRVRPWFPQLAQADAARARGEDRLFTGDPSAATADLDAAKAGYDAVLADAAKLRSAFRTRDRLFAELPFLTTWAVRTGAVADVAGLWTAAHAFDRRLVPPADPADLDRTANDLADRLDKLTERAVTPAEKLRPAPPAGTHPRTGRDAVEVALSLPTLSADRREAFARLADRFHREAVTADAVENPPKDETAGRQLALAAAALGPADPRPVFARVPDLPDEIQKLLDTDPIGNPAALRTAFAAADRLARTAPVGLPPFKAEPAVELRRVRAQDLALDFAERHADELWAGDATTDEPYYRQAGGVLLKDVAALGSLDPVRERLGKVRGRLDEPFRPTIVGTTPVTTTDAARFDVDVALGGGRRDALPGFAAVWAEPPAGVTLVDPAARRAVPWPETKSFRVAATSTATANAAAAVTVRGFFRGWNFAGRGPVDLYPVPDAVDTTGPPPAAAAVTLRASPDAVRKYGAGEGAVAIVIDCSGSMAAPETKGKPGTQTRYQLGVEAAGHIIAGLPRNTVVTVWTFGQEGDAEKRVDAVERTIQKVGQPFRRDPDDANQVPAVVGQLLLRKPYNLSPIYRALVTAREGVLSEKGYRAIVLISDGLDNRSATDAGLNAKKETLPALLKTRFRDELQRVTMHAVGFTPLSKRDAELGDQLRDFIETLTPAGKYVVAPDVGDLIAALRAGLSARLTARLTPLVGQPIDLEVTPGGTADRWAKAAAGGYTLTTDTTPDATAVLLSPGDRLLLGLDATAAGPSVRRLTLADEYPSRPFGRSDRGDWRATVIQNQKRPDGVTMLVGLEPTDTAARLTRPAAVWFELGVADFPDLAPASVRWRPVYDYPAPVWELFVSGWPTYPGTTSPARGTLRVWFEPTGSAAATGTKLLKELPLGAAPLPVPVGPETPRVERVDPASVGGPAPPPGTIALRVRHTPDRPVLVRLDGVEVVSAERRVFTKVGQTVGLFRLADAADPAAARVTLTPLASFQAAARRVDVRDLPPPDPNDNRLAR